MDKDPLAGFLAKRVFYLPLTPLYNGSKILLSITNKEIEMTTSSEFTKLWNMKFEEKKHTHKVVCASTGISIIGHGEEEAKKIAEYMTRKHHTKYVVEANES